MLVVDDSLDNQILIRRLLEVAGAHVETASDGWEGVRKAVCGQHHVILMDIHMPGGLDGNEATVLLRRNNYHRPIVALTANAMKVEREQSGIVGFNDYLIKPIDRDVLVSTVARCARCRPPSSELH